MATHKQIKAVSVYATRSIPDYDKNVVVVVVAATTAVYDTWTKVYENCWSERLKNEIIKTS